MAYPGYFVMKLSHACQSGARLGWFPPQSTSQDCSQCGHKVAKTLSTRTHRCPKGGL
ncbi:zinc ribbon domain-containing protein [Trichothermofontia sp.]